MIEVPDDTEPPGLWLRRLRLAAGLTQEEMAKRSGLSTRAIRDMERNLTREPYPASVRLVAGVLGLPEAAIGELIARFRVRGELGSSPPSGAAGSLPVSRDGEHDRAGTLPLVPRQLPTTVQSFTGRQAELAELTTSLEAMRNGGAVIISAVDGSPGVGKTALAVHWAHRVAAEFPDGQLYLNLRGFDPSGEVVEAETAIRGFLDAFHVPAERVPQSLESQTAMYRTLLAGKRVLVILDNARDPEQVRPLLPGSPGCLVVVTSRARLTGLAATFGARLITLDVLSTDEARELLSHRIGASRTEAEPDAVDELARLCGRLPLALAVAAAQAAARPGISLAAAAGELDDVAGRLQVLETADPATDVRTVFSWSYRMLDEPAARMFRLLGVHPGPDITAPAAAALLQVTKDKARTILRGLATVNLVSEHLPGRFTLHDLLRAYAAERAADKEPEPERRAALVRALDYYLHGGHAAALLLEPHRDTLPLAPPHPGAEPEPITDDRQAMAWFAAEHRVMATLLSLAASLGLDNYAWQLPAVLATFHERRGAWREHAASQEVALAAAQRAGDKTGQATAHNYLGFISVVRGSYEAAYWHIHQAIGLYRQVGSGSGEARARMVMGMGLDEQGRHSDARQQAERALGLYRAEGNRNGQAVALQNIGWVQGEQGQHQLALASLEQALDLFRALGHRPGEAAAWGSLGYVHSQLAHDAEACHCYTLAVELHGQLGDLWNQATFLARLGDVRSAAGQTQAAFTAWREAAEILDSLHDPDAEKLRAQIETAHLQEPCHSAG